MKEIRVWLYGSFNPLKFEFVEDYHETRNALILIQEDMYKTTTTKIFKQSLLRYEVMEQR